MVVSLFHKVYRTARSSRVHGNVVYCHYICWEDLFTVNAGHHGNVNYRWRRFVRCCYLETSSLPSSGQMTSEVWIAACSSRLRLELNPVVTMTMMINIRCCRRRNACAASARWKSRWTVRRSVPMPRRAPDPTQSWCCGVSEQCSASVRCQVVSSLQPHHPRLHYSFSVLLHAGIRVVESGVPWSPGFDTESIVFFLMEALILGAYYPLIVGDIEHTSVLVHYCAPFIRRI